MKGWGEGTLRGFERGFNPHPPWEADERITGDNKAAPVTVSIHIRLGRRMKDLADLERLQGFPVSIHIRLGRRMKETCGLTSDNNGRFQSTSALGGG